MYRVDIYIGKDYHTTVYFTADSEEEAYEAGYDIMRPMCVAVKDHKKCKIDVEWTDQEYSWCVELNHFMGKHRRWFDSEEEAMLAAHLPNEEVKYIKIEPLSAERTGPRNENYEAFLDKMIFDRD